MQITHHELCEFGTTASDVYVEDDLGHCLNCQKIDSVIQWHTGVMNETWQPILHAAVMRGKREGVLESLDALAELDTMHCFVCADDNEYVCQCSCELCNEAKLVERAVYLIRKRAQ